MTEKTTDAADNDRFTRLGRDEPDFERYADVDLEDGRVLLYDTDETDAWIQSDVTIQIEDVS